MTLAYREIPATWIEPTTAVLVEVVTAEAARDLGLRRPAIKYFAQGEPTPAAPAVAFWRHDIVSRVRERLVGTLSMGGGTIFLEHNLGQHAAMTTAAHEVRHAYQKANPGLFRGYEHEDLEHDAEAFAVGWMRKFEARR